MIQVDIRGLEIVQQFLETQPERTNKALRFAVNYAAAQGARRAKREILRQVAFKSAYLGNATSNDAPLRVGKRATEANLSAEIEAKHRPTSLARFAASPVQFGAPKGRRGIRVRVKPGSTSMHKRAFFVRLKRGKALTTDNYNVGLAVRLKPGEQLENKKDPPPATKSGLTILYGPSVEQLFNTVSTDISDDVAQDTQREFLRQFARLGRG